MKFGGTSVEDAKAMDRTAAIVGGRRKKGLEAIVVVSAMAKVTDQLLAAAAAAGRGDKSGALAISARLRNRHIDTATELLDEQRFRGAADGGPPGVRRSGRSAARHCGGGRADRADQRPGGQLRREALEPHGCCCLRSARSERNARRCAHLHHHGCELRQGGSAGGCDRGKADASWCCR